ncbi:hypothetical protein BC629DRAFT_1630154, partial [Irpex lacteus]
NELLQIPNGLVGTRCSREYVRQTCEFYFVQCYSDVLRCEEFIQPPAVVRFVELFERDHQHQVVVSATEGVVSLWPATGSKAEVEVQVRRNGRVHVLKANRNERETCSAKCWEGLDEVGDLVRRCRRRVSQLQPHSSLHAVKNRLQYLLGDQRRLEYIFVSNQPLITRAVRERIVDPFDTMDEVAPPAATCAAGEV